MLPQAPKKKIRLGLPATQWITVYNAHRPMKQRYHYNVANTRVDQHVEKGNDDGLYISSVACCHELWALIMDAGTGFTAQVGTPGPAGTPVVAYHHDNLQLCIVSRLVGAVCKSHVDQLQVCSQHLVHWLAGPCLGSLGPL